MNTRLAFLLCAMFGTALLVIAVLASLGAPMLAGVKPVADFAAGAGLIGMIRGISSAT